MPDSHRATDKPTWPAPRSLYIHVPFCRHRCGYCNFTLIAGRDDRIQSYLNALAVELQKIPVGTELDTLFFGGGTPTHLPAPALEQLWRLLTDRVQLTSGAEICFEANPQDLLQTEKLDALQSFGTTRVSLGVQSFLPRKLQLLERDHDPQSVRRVLDDCRARFQSLSLDLIFATPHETLAEWLSDLELALQSPIDHLSTYSLTIEKGTAFWNRWNSGSLERIDEEVEAQQYRATLDTVCAAGFEHYEVSNFAKPGHRSRHNCVYWSDLPYYALGPGAAQFVDGVRSVNHRSTMTWIKRLERGESPEEDREVIDAQQRARDRFIFGMRQLSGVDLSAFVQATGFEPRALAPAAWDRCLELGYFVLDEKTVRLSRSGLLISDSLWGDFLERWPEADSEKSRD